MPTPDDDARAGRRGSGGRPPPVRKSLGQHFLSDPRILARIADAARLQPSDTVVEIGPGRGALTTLLLERAGRVVAIEYDRALATLLRERYAHEPRLTVVQADVLDVDLAGAAGGDYTLVGNVPYYITTPILFRALEPPRPRRAVYLVQREVAERVAAPPGSDAYGALSVNVQAVARVARLFRVAAGAFHPPPKVESAVLRVEPRDEPVVRPAEEVRFRRFVQDAFGLRRKQMRRVLRTVFDLDAGAAERALRAAGVDPDSRPETLAPEDFAAVLRALSPGSSARSSTPPAPSPCSPSSP